MKLVAFYCIYNEADFIEYSLKSIYDYVDKIIIIEGAWKETYVVNGNLRSNDGTIDIIENFPDPDKKVDIYYHNENSQLEQRNKLWDYLKEDCLMLLVDGDEVWTPEELKKVRALLPMSEAYRKMQPHTVYTVNSLVFINDINHYSPVRYPRIWTIYKNNKYKFIEPNRILYSSMDFVDFDMKITLDINYFHFSYCHTPERFMEKKRERTKLHGFFPWSLDENNKIVRADADIRKFEGEHPIIMASHPLYKGEA
jgi:hypothetical protein